MITNEVHKRVIVPCHGGEWKKVLEKEVAVH